MDSQQKNYYCVLPKEMPELERRALAHKVYNEAHSKIFDGVSFNDFYHTVFTPDSILTKLMIITKHGKINGYASFHVFEINLEDGPVYVMMTEMGMTEFVKHPLNFMINEGVKYHLQNRDKKIYVLDTFITPYIYQKCCKKVHEIYPRYNRETPVDLSSLLHKVGNYFNWQIDTQNNVMIRTLKWKIKSQYLMQHYNKNADDKDVAYYKDLIPNYVAGKGLVMIIPMSVTNSLLTIARSYLIAMQHTLQNNTGYLQQVFLTVVNGLKLSFKHYPRIG